MLAVASVAERAKGYGIPGVTADGNDVVEVYDVVQAAVDRARRGEGPTFVEALTYRIGAHSTSDDPTRYRSDAEVESWKKKDPVDRLAKHLRLLGLVDDAHEKDLDEERAKCRERIESNGNAADTMEGQLLDLTTRFCQPLRGRTELAPLFKELEMDAAAASAA